METRQDDLKLMLAGIASERQAIQARLTWLDTRERELREAGVLGAADTKRTGRPKKAKGTKKGATSPAARQKIAEAQKARWARVRAEKAAAEQAKAATVPPAYETSQNVTA